MKKENEKTPEISAWLNLFLIGAYLISMAVSWILYGVIGGSFKQAYQVGLFCCVFLLPLWLFMRSMEWELDMPGWALCFSLLFFGLTAGLVMVSVHINTCLLWIGGCIFLTALFPTGIGIGFFLFFGCLFCFLCQATVSYEVFMFIFGTILCGSVSFLKKKKPAVLVIIIDLILYTLLFFILTQGNRAYFEWQSVVTMAGQAVFLAAAKGLCAFFGRTGNLIEDGWDM